MIRNSRLTRPQKGHLHSSILGDVKVLDVCTEHRCSGRTGILVSGLDVLNGALKLRDGQDEVGRLCVHCVVFVLCEEQDKVAQQAIACKYI